MPDWETLYVSLAHRHYRRRERRSDDQFDFALFIAMRADYQEAGTGWLKSEAPSERLGLRGLMLAANGNVLCMDWGIPVDGGQSLNRDSDQVLIERWDHPQGRSFDWEQRYRKKFKMGIAFGSIFAELIRNGNYLRPVSSEEPVLPPEYVEKFYSAARGELFSPERRKRARWHAKYCMLFLSDAYEYHTYRWHTCSALQEVFVKRLIRLGLWLRSSSWTEWAMDAAVVLLMSVVRLGIVLALAGRLDAAWAVAVVVLGPFVWASWKVGIASVMHDYKSSVSPVKRASIFAVALATALTLLNGAVRGRDWNDFFPLAFPTTWTETLVWNPFQLVAWYCWRDFARRYLLVARGVFVAGEESDNHPALEDQLRWFAVVALESPFYSRPMLFLGMNSLYMGSIISVHGLLVLARAGTRRINGWDDILLGGWMQIVGKSLGAVAMLRAAREFPWLATPLSFPSVRVEW
jgi:hypothetical protein